MVTSEAHLTTAPAPGYPAPLTLWTDKFALERFLLRLAASNRPEIVWIWPGSTRFVLELSVGARCSVPARPAERP
jgi:hypothetical protein